ncbi:Transposase, IS4 [Nitrococcus mobilis Nb-231]|uniref:Transposase, IS4 n=1 Tax=Nitrococcus mobilis Nb-231 TaxID=314278 RepID=A4BN07_9GAMM|nr:Transposase, IS4 [Nitrococcus mobilis Nb-231]
MPCLACKPRARRRFADKGYDYNAVVEYIEAQHAETILSPRYNRNAPHHYDRHRYKARNLVECCLNRLKQFRRVANDTNNSLPISPPWSHASTLCSGSRNC